MAGLEGARQKVGSMMDPRAAEIIKQGYVDDEARGRSMEDMDGLR